MGHNVWSHINSVQEANRQYDQGIVPKMLVQETFDRVYFRDVVDRVFAAGSRAEAEEIINTHSKFWDTIIGTRGLTGKRISNPTTNFYLMYKFSNDNEEDFDSDAEENLEHLMQEVKNES